MDGSCKRCICTPYRGAEDTIGIRVCALTEENISVLQCRVLHHKLHLSTEYLFGDLIM